MIPRRKLARLTLAVLALAVLGSGPLTAMAQATRIRVGGDIKAPTKTKHVAPVYPEEAKAREIQGTVILEILVGTDGRVLDTEVRRSVPLLDAAAVTAVMQWEYTPTLMNGEPVELLMTVTINFTLG